MSSPLWDGVREGCGSCEFGKRHEWRNGDQAHVRVACRRYPPQIVQTIEKSPYDSTVYEVNQFCPIMAEDDWCGEWRRKDNREA